MVVDRSVVSLSRCQSALDGLSLLLSSTTVGELYEEAGPDQVSAWDQSLEPKLLSALQEQTARSLSLLRSRTGAPALQSAGGRFVAQCCASPTLGQLLRDMGAADILAAAVRAHPQERQVQSQAQWALFRLQGWEQLLAILRDPQLSCSEDVVRAALWSISHAGEKWLAPGPDGPSSSTRRDLVELTLLALRRFGADAEVAAYGLGVISCALVSRVQDGQAEAGLAAVEPVLMALQTHWQDQAVVSNGARALANLVEGNSRVSALLQQHSKEVAGVLDTILAHSSNADALLNMCRVHSAVSGAEHLLQLLQSSRLQKPEQQKAVLLTFGRHAEDCDASALLQAGMVDRVCEIIHLEQDQDIVPAGIAALGYALELLVEDAIRSSGCRSPSQMCDDKRVNMEVEKGLAIIIQRLQVEIASSKPNVQVYAEALLALRNVSRRSSSLASRIASSEPVRVAVNLALERDYFSLNFSSLSQLLGAVVFFTGLPQLQKLLEKYPTAPVFHEAACLVLIEEVEHQEGSTEPGTVLAAASNIACYATWVLKELLAYAPMPEPLAANAVRLLGHVLGHAAQAQAHQQSQSEVPSEPVILMEGIRSLLQVLRDYPHSSWLASEVCNALVHIVATDRVTMLPTLAVSGAGHELVALISRFHDDLQVISDAATAMGVLDGPRRVAELMRCLPLDYAVQLAGCQAYIKICRLNSALFNAGEREVAAAAVEGARQLLLHNRCPWLEAQVELAAGLLAGSGQSEGKAT